ncbi:chloroplastic group IIA intron splicing facilitator CRS1, chloroplastic-like [Zingiber officinale]|uniref:chloroplastic group IIA intron splicing facilitator CRS1, chloroplastic-like n=1 Tax=Zingiber officinale TaxID=94328 RepID=UPI001C4AF1CA|nr:chloroplastic group IIA intron splicing facilitator CRS1, chloroplastic-like [Zingiber officinale]
MMLPPPSPHPSSASFSFLPIPSPSLRSLSLHPHLFRPPRLLASDHLDVPSPASERENRPPSSVPPWILADGADSLKMPTAPWMSSPLVLPRDQVLDPSSPRRSARRKHKNDGRADRDLTEKVRGGRSRYAMLGIIRNIKSLRELHSLEADDEKPTSSGVSGGTQVVDLDIPLGTGDSGAGRRIPWVSAEVDKLVFRREKKVKEITAAELVLAPDLLFRLRGEAKKMKKWVKAKKAGVTQVVVEEIQRGWRNDELVMVRIVEPLRRNMDRAREIVETKTGGLVVWIKRDFLVIYRGEKYGMILHTPSCYNAVDQVNLGIFDSNRAIFSVNSGGIMKDMENNIYLTNKNSVTQHPVEGSLYEREANRLLDGLGPRFVDWWWRTPLPVDADLLPEVVPSFRPPFRMRPPGIRVKLTDDELTYLRKLARSLPTHFALGRNTKLQGLASSIIKLWKKSCIAKIAIKIGIQNTNNEQMSLELKRLTGGVLILRNKFFIILYRGKDFLPDGVFNLIEEREAELDKELLVEEEARLSSTNLTHTMDAISLSSNSAGTRMEFQNIQTNHVRLSIKNHRCQVQIEAEKEKLEKELRLNEHRLFILNQKIEKSNQLLSKLSLSWCPSDQIADQEILTEEERQAFRKIGLAMDEVILLGRRGIYNGVIGSIHQHWKHREVVKVITKQKAKYQVNYSARLLEVECGGILVAVEKLRTSHAIIIYRGKNYARPLQLPDNILTKREALQRSIEIQRRGSLKHFSLQREKAIRKLKQRLRALERKSSEMTIC